MVRQIRRLALLGGSLALLGFVAAAIAGVNSQPAGAASVYTVEILDSGFNPPLCQVNRNGDRIRWKNLSSKTARISVLDLGGVDNPPLAESEDIPPGELSVFVIQVDAMVDRTYTDTYAPTHTGRFLAPRENSAAASCSPLPPTPTPAPTPTPRPSPGTISDMPPSCMGLMPVSRQPISGCSLVTDVARDGGT